jgi:hypothetical protein
MTCSVSFLAVSNFVFLMLLDVKSRTGWFHSCGTFQLYTAWSYFCLWDFPPSNCLIFFDPLKPRGRSGTNISEYRWELTVSQDQVRRVVVVQLFLVICSLLLFLIFSVQMEHSSSKLSFCLLFLCHCSHFLIEYRCPLSASLSLSATVDSYYCLPRKSIKEADACMKHCALEYFNFRICLHTCTYKCAPHTNSLPSKSAVVLPWMDGAKPSTDDSQELQ